jgi:preprotein translocase SecE subunit
MNFIKNALRELKHVVWPTREETKKYFIVVLAVLIAFGLFLFVFGSLFGNTLR